jgi:RNA polymerase sigma-70 factor (ECF subfamily)
MADAADLDRLTERLRAGDAGAADKLFAVYRDRLKKVVRLRLDSRLRGRLDDSDVLQEAFLDVQKKVDEFASRGMPAYLWVRLITAERLLQLHRHHLGAQMRDAGQEVSLHRGGTPGATTHSLALIWCPS